MVNTVRELDRLDPKKRSRLLFLSAIVLAGILASWFVRRTASPGNAERLSFNQTIQPVLSENCYACHGPDPGARKAGLRLDRAEFAFAAHDKFGPAIVRGNPNKSPLVQRIESSDPKQRMPPPEAHRTLKPEQVALLRQWVKEGAVYEEHWSFIAPKLPAVPETKNRQWVRNPIDEFILSRLEKEGLAPSEEADRPTLIRRVTYDLTGMPPTPEEVRAFVLDGSADAYEKVVDRLLESPRYGEHRAHYWLDVARYGDTHGLHLDNFRSIWPYRDYVIKSYNQNKRFDDFVKEQIAGDMLPAKTLDSIVASAFLRAGISSGEGGSLIEELRVNNKRERAEAFGAAFLGLTTGCAVCHDHKFDPITRNDFYRLTAFFNNLTENPSNDDRQDWPPFIRVPKDNNRAAYEQTLAKRSAIENQIHERRIHARELVTAWMKDPQTKPRPVDTADLQVRLRFDEQNGGDVRQFCDIRGTEKRFGDRESGDLGRGNSALALHEDGYHDPARPAGCGRHGRKPAVHPCTMAAAGLASARIQRRQVAERSDCGSSRLQKWFTRLATPHQSTQAGFYASSRKPAQRNYG